MLDDRGPYGSSTSNKIVIRGMGGDGQSRVMVLVDGVPALAPGPGIFEWSTLDKNSVERIEVVKGPSSALYGSSAMGGVINIITRAPIEDGFATRLRTRFGTYDTLDTSVHHTGSFGRFGYSLALSRGYTKGFNAVPRYSPSSRPTFTNTAPEKVLTYSADLKLRYRFDETADLTLTANWADYDRTGRYRGGKFVTDDYVLYSLSKRSLGLHLNKDFGSLAS